MTCRDLRPLMITECPAVGGARELLDELNALDGAAGVRLARLDPTNAADFEGKATEPARLQRCVDRTLQIFERRNLLQDTSEWCLLAARQRWELPGTCWLGPHRVALAGRRVVLVGCVREAAGLRGLPPLRWLRMGGPGEPAEICYLPHPAGRGRSRADGWYRSNGDAVSAWLAAERARLFAAERSWSTFGDSSTMLGELGCFAFRAADQALRWLPSADAAWSNGETVMPGTERATWVLRALATGLTRIPRWSGASDCNVAAHSLRVALVARVLHPDAGKRGAGHDGSEALPGVGDQPTPAKRWMQFVSPEFNALHRGADELVLDLCGCADDPPDVVEAVHFADRVAMATERAVYFGDAPEWLGDVRPVASAILADPDLALRIMFLDRNLPRLDGQQDWRSDASRIGDAMRGDFSWVDGETAAIAGRLADLAKRCV